MGISQQWVALMTIARKELLRFARIWLQTILPPVVMVTLYFIIFGNLIGSQIEDMGGFSYMQYIVPGLILMSVITNSYANVVSSFFSAKFQRHVEEMLVSPTPNHIIILGFMVGGMVRGWVVGIAVTLVSMIFSEIHFHNIFIAGAVLILTSILFSLAGFINAVFAETFDDITIIPTFVLTPLTYLGGIFYSLELLPDIWRNVSLLNPILYLVNVFRYGILGVSDVDVYAGFAIAILFIVILFAAAMYLLNRGVGVRD